MSLPERTPAQRAQDDEDHRLALCGLSFDARSEDELEDFYSRHYDRELFSCEEPVEVRRKRRPLGNVDEGLVTPSCARRHLEIDAPPRTFIFASGHPQAQPPQTRSGLVVGRNAATPASTASPPPLPERFWAKVRLEGDCWIWTAYRDKGYGRFSLNGRLVRAHRLTYEHFVGPIPKDLQLDHLCRNRPCVNPAHLELVTTAENLRRGDTAAARNAAKTHCYRGHPFDDENTHIDCKGHRVCRSCRREKNRNERIRARARRVAVTPERMPAATPLTTPLTD